MRGSTGLYLERLLIFSPPQPVDATHSYLLAVGKLVVSQNCKKFKFEKNMGLKDTKFFSINK